MGLAFGVVAITAVGVALIFGILIAYVGIFMIRDQRAMWRPLKKELPETEESAVARFVETPAPSYAGPWRG